MLGLAQDMTSEKYGQKFFAGTGGFPRPLTNNFTFRKTGIIRHRKNRRQISIVFFLF
jgi:hypothetical protein